jgi:hypothetical protein
MQSAYLLEWEWKDNGIRFRGATQALDIKIEYEKSLPKLGATSDPVPIRGCSQCGRVLRSRDFHRIARRSHRGLGGKESRRRHHALKAVRGTPPAAQTGSTPSLFGRRHIAAFHLLSF